RNSDLDRQHHARRRRTVVDPEPGRRLPEWLYRFGLACHRPLRPHAGPGSRSRPTVNARGAGSRPTLSACAAGGDAVLELPRRWREMPSDHAGSASSESEIGLDTGRLPALASLLGSVAIRLARSTCVDTFEQVPGPSP